jgi:hypothetical protein
MSWGWGHMSTTPTSLNNLNVSFFFFFFTIVLFDICLNLFDNFQNPHFTPTPIINEKLNFPCPQIPLFEYLTFFLPSFCLTFL